MPPDEEVLNPNAVVTFVCPKHDKTLRGTPAWYPVNADAPEEEQGSMGYYVDTSWMWCPVADEKDDYDCREGWAAKNLA